MPPGVASCASGDGQVEPGWLSARLVSEEMEGSASKGLGWGQDWIYFFFFQQLGSSFQSSPGGLDDQLLSLGSLAQITTQVTPNPRIGICGLVSCNSMTVS